jgi:hypothetical protein
MIAGRGGTSDLQVFGKYVGTAFSRFEQLNITSAAAADTIDEGHVEIRIYP